MADVTIYIKIFVSLFVLVNPLEGIPVFLARTEKMETAPRKAIERTAAVGVTVILLTSLIIGRGLLQILNISIGAFTTAGGIIIFLIGLMMVRGGTGTTTTTRSGQDIEDKRFALVPLAMPLLAGPGAISAVIVYASKGPSGSGCTITDYFILGGIIVVVGLATWISLRMADPLRRLLGDTGIEVCTRISGILVAAIAIDLIQEGLVRLFPTVMQQGH
jgi:multiple antibiotic resistance protein